MDDAGSMPVEQLPPGSSLASVGRADDAAVLGAERERIANELVDGVVHRLFALGLSIQRVANESPTQDSSLLRFVNETDEIIDMIRDIVFPGDSLND